MGVVNESSGIWCLRTARYSSGLVTTATPRSVANCRRGASQLALTTAANVVSPVARLRVSALSAARLDVTVPGGHGNFQGHVHSRLIGASSSQYQVDIVEILSFFYRDGCLFLSSVHQVTEGRIFRYQVAFQDSDSQQIKTTPDSSGDALPDFNLVFSAPRIADPAFQPGNSPFQSRNSPLQPGNSPFQSRNSPSNPETVPSNRETVPSNRPTCPSSRACPAFRSATSFSSAANLLLAVSANSANRSGSSSSF